MAELSSAEFSVYAQLNPFCLHMPFVPKTMLTNNKASFYSLHSPILDFSAFFPPLHCLCYQGCSQLTIKALGFKLEINLDNLSPTSTLLLLYLPEIC